ncbi:hypothetical protein KKC60_01955 [Patescibacteria group bacterium]|nr:hypothetical protein [Patescibacteria group bacterium]
MKITLCGSSAFRVDMVECKRRLNDMRHEAVLHPDYEAFVNGQKQDLWERVEREHAQVKKEQNYIKWYYEAITGSDAVLVLNLDKKDKQNYIGGNTLMEMAFAHVHDKRIYLLNPVPEYLSYKDEILAMYSEVLNGDLAKIR